jgi:hypothetical protein
MGTINSSDRIAATLYSLGTLFVSGIYVKIPCIKEIVMMMMIIIIIALSRTLLRGPFRSRNNNPDVFLNVHSRFLFPAG